MKRQPSRHEKQFALLWRLLGGPQLTPEFRFHAKRKWRSDYAHELSRTLIELEGAVWSGGRHTRGAGFVADAEKYLEATLAGWRVIRLVPSQINSLIVARLIYFVQSTSTPGTPAR